MQAQLAAATYSVSGVDPGNRPDSAPLNDIIPEAPETLQRAGRVIALLAGGISTDEKSVTTYVEKYLPFARKMLAEPRFREFSREISGKLVDRLLTRSIRGFFGVGMATTPTEQRP